jgi:hypothetical protein
MDHLDTERDTMLQIKTKTHKYAVEWLPESEEWTGSQLSLAYGKDAENSIKRIVADTEKKDPFWNLFGGTIELCNGNRYQVFAKGAIK